MRDVPADDYIVFSQYQTKNHRPIVDNNDAVAGWMTWHPPRFFVHSFIYDSQTPHFPCQRGGARMRSGTRGNRREKEQIKLERRQLPSISTHASIRFSLSLHLAGTVIQEYDSQYLNHKYMPLNHSQAKVNNMIIYLFSCIYRNSYTGKSSINSLY